MQLTRAGGAIEIIKRTLDITNSDVSGNEEWYSRYAAPR
jgi:hypothetical protein